MTQQKQPFDYHENQLAGNLLKFSTKRLFRMYKRLHPLEGRHELIDEFYSDLGYCIARLKSDRPVLWEKLKKDSSPEAISQPAVIGYLGLSMKRKAVDALRASSIHSKISRYYEEVVEVSQNQVLEPQLDTVQAFLQDLKETDDNIEMVLVVLKLMFAGYNRQEISNKTRLSVHQVGRLITRVRKLARKNFKHRSER